jgi:hypothetical protein
VLSSAQDKKAGDKKPAADPSMMGDTAGPEHAVFAPMVGNWDAAVSFAMAPGAPMMTSKGTYNVRSLDKMWNVGDFTGDMMGTPFHGVGVLGYDHTTKQYVSYWYDSMASHQASSSGTYDAAKKTFTMKGKAPNMTGGSPTEMVDQTEITEVKDNDTVLFKMVQAGPDKKDVTVMSIEYKRKK